MPSKRSRLFALGALLLSLHPGPAGAAVKVVTTTQDLASFVQSIGGTDVEVNSIVRGDLDPHFVDAKPSYMLKIASADLVVCIGMELEVGWLPSLLSGSRNPKVQPGAPGYLDTSAGIPAIDKPGGSIDRSRGDLHPLGNPHYWMDPANGHIIARSIAARLSQIDPSHAAVYNTNLAAFERDLSAREAAWTEQMNARRGVAVVGYHTTFNYFLNRYGLPVVGFVEPKPGIPPTPQHTLELGQAAKAQGARFILIEPFHNPRDAAPVAKASGAKVVSAPTSVGATPSIKTWFDLIDALVRAVQ